jgi:hypothetical protein
MEGIADRTDIDQSGLVSCVEEFYLRERPHQGVGNRPLSGADLPEASPLAVKDVVCETRLGGLLKHYRRAG